MISSVNSLSSSSISLLFGTRSTTGTTPTGSPGERLLTQATGNTDLVLKAGNAIGNIIEIAARIKQSDALFTMEGAKRIDGFDGEYSLTKTGTGTVVSNEQLWQNGIDIARQQARGTGVDAERSKALLKAIADGSLEEIDLSAHGVSATMTQTNYYYADGRDKGVTGSWAVTGLSEFLKANTYEGEDGALRDRATGKYAAINQNGTQFSYIVF